MPAYSNAGMSLVSQNNAAASGMRSMRDDLWRKVYENRQKQMMTGLKNQKKDRQMMMVSAMLSGGASLIPGLMGGGGSTLSPGAMGGHDIQINPALANPFYDPRMGTGYA